MGAASVIDDPYLVLNVPHTTATDDEIKRSYRILAKKYHPDTWSAPCFTQSEKDHATTIFQKVASAYELLSDTTQKSIYDRNYKLGMYDDDKVKDKDGVNENKNKNTDDCRGTKSSSSSSSSNTNNNNNNNNNRNSPRHQRQHHQPHPESPRRPVGVPPPLPKGWTTTKDSMSGNLYYHHRRSGRSSWNHPALISNTSEYENNNNNNNNSNSNTPKMNTNFNFGKNGTPKMSGGDFPFNRRTNDSNNEHIFNNHYTAYNENNNNNNNNHQNNNKKNSGKSFDPNYDETIYAGGRKIIVDDEPDTHRCGAFVASLLNPPLGLLAAYHSIMVTVCLNRANEVAGSSSSSPSSPSPLVEEEDKNETPESKKKKQTELAIGHSNRAAIYSCIGNTTGMIFWIYYLLMREDSKFEWPKEWSFDEWFDDK